MTRLIKAHDPVAPTVTIHQVRRPEGRPAPSENVVSLEVLALKAEVEELNRRVEHEREQADQLRTDAERLKADVARALQEGEERGRKAGALQGQEDRAALLKTLDAAVTRALVGHHEALQSLDRLAPLLAREALGKVLDDPGPKGDLIAQIIRGQIQRIGAHSVIAVQVSRSDFPNDEQLQPLRASSGVSGIVIEALDQLSSGDCRIRLALGELDVGVGQQWSRLSELLLGLAEPGAVP